MMYRPVWSFLMLICSLNYNWILTDKFAEGTYRPQPLLAPKKEI